MNINHGAANSFLFSSLLNRGVDAAYPMHSSNRSSSSDSADSSANSSANSADSSDSSGSSDSSDSSDSSGWCQTLTPTPHHSANILNNQLTTVDDTACLSGHNKQGTGQFRGLLGMTRNKIAKIVSTNATTQTQQKPAEST